MGYIYQVDHGVSTIYYSGICSPNRRKKKNLEPPHFFYKEAC